MSSLYACLYLGLPLLAGYLINQIYPFTPAYYERTLLLAAPAYWLLIAAGLIWLWDRQYLLVGTAVIAMLVIVAVSLTGFYTIPRFSVKIIARCSKMLPPGPRRETRCWSAINGSLVFTGLICRRRAPICLRCRAGARDGPGQPVSPNEPKT